MVDYDNALEMLYGLEAECPNPELLAVKQMVRIVETALNHGKELQEGV